jgi:LPXTG-motif cell wall-anchored protein
VAQNTGDITLRGLTIDDPTAGVIRCDALELAPGAVATCRSLPHTITTGDADRGRIVNSATATATDPRGGTVTSDVATAEVDVVMPPEPPEPPAPPGPPAPPAPPAPPGAEGAGSGLPSTGSATEGSWALAALAMIGVGAAALLRRRGGRAES